jgi:hypothetical protein
MAFNVATLTAFNNEQAGPMLTEALLSLKTFDYVNIQYGVTYQEPLNLITVSSGISCSFDCPSWTESASTSFTQRLITVDQLVKTDSWCFDKLKKYWMFNKLTPGSTQVEPETAFFTMLKDVFLKKFMSELETAIWQGNSTNSCTVDGFIAQISESYSDGDGVIVTSPAAGALTTSNIDTHVFEAISSASAAMQDSEMYLYMGTDTRDIWMQYLTVQNPAYYYAQPAGTQLIVPGFNNITIAPVGGLNGTGVIVLTTKDNLWIGMDELKDFNSLSTWFENKDDKSYVRAKVKLGTQFAFPAQIVTNANVLA